MAVTIDAYPLQWPAGWPRTKRPRDAPFRTSFRAARDSLFRELELMGARYVVLSTNIPLRGDGLPYANQPNPQDAGAAVYYERKGRSIALPCDEWTKVTDNVQALRKSIEALRGLERWGASQVLERAYEGFAALPAPGATEHWRDVFGLSNGAGPDDVQRRYRELAARAHPDKGGSDEAMARLNRARADAVAEVGA